jgi:hypothetical protein
MATGRLELIVDKDTDFSLSQPMQTVPVAYPPPRPVDTGLSLPGNEADVA